MISNKTSCFGLALVAHLDILGFKNIVNSIKSNQEMIDLGLNIESAFNGIKSDENYLIKTFSDNIMLVDHIEDKVLNERKAFSFVYYVAKIQLEFIKKFGWFIRGGISYGPHYHSQITVVSQPLTAAYVLESTKVIYPFVGIAHMPKLPIHTTPFNPYREAKTYKLIDILTFKHPEHNFRCVDYLFASLLSDLTEAPSRDMLLSKIAKTLNIHKKIIEQQLNTVTDQKIKSKYIALAMYHNNFLNSYLRKTDLLALMGLGYQFHSADLVYEFLYNNADFIIRNIPAA